ncbi:MAG: peptidoglycan-binding domain-containing protein [Patescibacteria group bacterium]
MKKLLTVLAGSAIAVAMVVGAPTSAGAQTVEELQAQIQELMAQIQDLTAADDAPSTGVSELPATLQANLAPDDTGAAVKALQEWLNANGYTVASSGPGSAGNESEYYGSLTQDAVGDLQDDLGVDYGEYRGYWGPSTRAAVEATMVESEPEPGLPEGCTDTTGFSPVTGEPCDTEVEDLPEGCTDATGFSPVTGEPCDGSDPEDDDEGDVAREGSMDVSRNSSPSNVELKKGQTKDVMGFEVDVRDSDITLNRIDVRFDARPWLYFDKIAIMDGDTVVAEIADFGSSDFTEITSGSEYRLRFSNVDYVVPKDSKKDLTVRISALSFTDREDAEIEILTDDYAVRGTDTVGLSHESGWSGRKFDFTASSVGQITPTLSSDTPQKRNVEVDSDYETEGVELLVFKLKADNQDVEINELKFDIASTTGSANDIADMLTRVELYEGSNLIGTADTIAATTTFTDLEYEISKDETKTLRLVADVSELGDNLAADDGVQASLAADSVAIVGEDTNYEDVTVGGSTVTSEEVTFVDLAVSVSDMSAVASAITDNPALAQVTFQFTLSSNGGDVYISKTAATAISDSSSASSSAIDEITSSSKAGDTGSDFFVADGTSRTFTVQANMDNTGGTAGNKNLSIDEITWGETAGANDKTIDFGIDDLYVSQYLTAS